MPVASIRTERPLIELLLSEYENGTWKGLHTLIGYGQHLPIF